MSTRTHRHHVDTTDLGHADGGFLLVMIAVVVLVAAPLLTLWLG